MCRPLLKLLIAKSRGLRAFKSSVRELTTFEPCASRQRRERSDHRDSDEVPEVYEDAPALKAVKEPHITLQRTELCNKTLCKDQLETSPDAAKSEFGGADQVSSRSMV